MSLRDIYTHISQMTTADWAKFSAIAVTIASMLRIGLVWLKGLVEIWYPQREINRDAVIWQIFGKLDQSLAYISLSRHVYAPTKEEKLDKAVAVVQTAAIDPPLPSPPTERKL